MHLLLVAIFCSLTLAALVGLGGIPLIDRWLKIRGVTIVEGGRHYLAFIYAMLIGAPLGAWCGWTMTWRLAVAPASTVSAASVATVAALGGLMLGGVAGFYLGYRLAEWLEVPNGILVRATWSFTRVAIPLGIVGAVVAFWFGWTGCRA